MARCTNGVQRCPKCRQMLYFNRGAGSGAHLTILGNDAELVVVAHGAVVVYCQEHGREFLEGGNATKIACCCIFSGVTPTRRR